MTTRSLLLQRHFCHCAAGLLTRRAGMPDSGPWHEVARRVRRPAAQSRVVVLLAAALGLLWAMVPAVGPAVAAADGAPPAVPAKVPAAEKPETGAGAAETTPKTAPLGKPDKPASLNLGAPEYSTSKLIWNTLAAAVVVLVLGGIVLYFMKRVMPRIGIGHGKRVAVIETTYLGPQRAVHLVQVGARCLLVGATRESVRLVADVTDAFGQDPESAQPKKKFVIPGEMGAER